MERSIARDACATLGRAVDFQDIIVDVPERLSFDVHIPVIDPEGRAEPEEAPWGADSPVFGSRGGDDIPRSLRHISICARRDDELASALARMGLLKRFEA